MGMTNCKDCGEAVSTSARACPKCGAKAPRVKWWLWIPLALVGAFLAIGALTPEYKARALAQRDACERMVPALDTLGRRECDRIYREAIAAGEKR